MKFIRIATTATFKVDVDADEDVREEALVLGAMVQGVKATYGENLSKDDPHETLGPIDFTDTTGKKIWPLTMEEVYTALREARNLGDGDNNRWEPTEKMTLEAKALFGWPSTTTRVGISNPGVDDPAILTASASGDMVTLTAMSDGETEVEITATVAEESSPFMPSQTVSNVASIKFKVMVDAPIIVTRSNEQALATAAVAKAAAASPNNIWEPERGVTAMILLAATATEDGLFDVPASITPTYLAVSSNDNVMASVSGMNVELRPMVAGMAMVTVTAVDTDRPGNAVSVDFNVTVTGAGGYPRTVAGRSERRVRGTGRRRLGGAGIVDRRRHEQAVRGGGGRDAQLLGRVQ